MNKKDIKLCPLCKYHPSDLPLGYLKLLPVVIKRFLTWGFDLYREKGHNCELYIFIQLITQRFLLCPSCTRHTAGWHGCGAKWLHCLCNPGVWLSSVVLTNIWFSSPWGWRGASGRVGSICCLLVLGAGRMMDLLMSYGKKSCVLLPGWSTYMLMRDPLYAWWQAECEVVAAPLTWPPSDCH